MGIKEKGDKKINNKLDCGFKKIIDDYSNLKEFDIRIIGEHLKEGIIIIDSNGFVEYVNDGYCSLAGCKKEDILGIGSENLIKDLKIVLSKKDELYSIVKFEKTGKTTLSYSMYTLDYQGHINKVIVFLIDISSVKDLHLEPGEVYSSKYDNSSDVRYSDILARQEANLNLIGKSAVIKNLIYYILRVAPFDTTVLITGETGVGKEVVANKIHKNSSRSKEKFVKINCAAIPKNLAEAELFGYEKGAFTGASENGKKGVFEEANGGTLLLDEIDEMPYELQPKLLRAIQFKEITRVGSKKPVKTDVRIIACTSKDLRRLVDEGKFNEALYYRLNVFKIHVPPLRERTEDIPLLISHFLSIYNEKYSKNVALTDKAISLLQEYRWPGNVRELQHFIERLIIISQPSQLIYHDEVLNILHNGKDKEVNQTHGNKGLKEILSEIEKSILENAIRSTKSTREAAKILKIDQSNVVRKAKKYGIKIQKEA